MLVRTLFRLPAAGRFLPSPSALRRLASASGAFAALAAGSAANAQYFGGYDPCCSSCQTVCQPVCCQQQQMAMVVQPCYQQVPVTEYVPEKQTVMRPQLETAYEEREFTEMRPVTEARTAEVPVTTYQPVTEMQSVCQDRSYYQTRYVPNCRMSPCQYDSRPGLFGWMNRTGYEVRSAFTPRYTAYREYVPNQVAMQVPVTRMVAQQGSRQVTYNVTRYEPHKTMRQVAVTRTKMVAQEVTVHRPVTTYRTVPVGTTVAYAPVGVGGSAVAFGGGTISNVAYGPINYGSGATATAFGPSPDPLSTARREEIIRSRTAERERERELGKPNGHEFKRSEKKADEFGEVPGNSSIPQRPTFRKLTATEKQDLLNSRRLARADQPAGEVAAHEALKPVIDAPATDEPATETPARESALAAAFERPNTPVPFAVRSVRWTPSKPTGPTLIAPALAAAE
jgi:hypothetical protein